MRDHRNSIPKAGKSCTKKRELLKQRAVGRILALIVAAKEPHSINIQTTNPRATDHEVAWIGMPNGNKGAKERQGSRNHITLPDSPVGGCGMS